MMTLQLLSVPMTAYESLRDHIQRIKRLAEENWGNTLNTYGRPEWEAKLVAEYTRLENLDKGEENQVTANSRRSQIIRALENYSCGGETLLRLYAAVGCKLKIFREQEV